MREVEQEAGEQEEQSDSDVEPGNE